MQPQRRNLQGYCQEGCGACCKFLVLNVNPQYAQEKDVRYWLELHGIRLVERGGAVWAYIPTPCSALLPDMKCGLFGTKERPELCSDWPFSQAEIDSLKEYTGTNCTFYFSEGDEK